MIADRFGRDRRWFLRTAGGSAALAAWLRQGIAKAAGAPPARRLVIVSRPNGTIAEDWLRGADRGPILEPFAPVWEHAVALKGVDVQVTKTTSGDPHSKGSINIMTGAGRNPAKISGNDNHWNTVESLDQRLARESLVLRAPLIKSIQLGAWTGGPAGDAPSRALSFLGPANPLYPEVSPAQAYRRLFGSTIMPGGSTPAGSDALNRLRLDRESVLRFVRGDLGRVRAQLPAAARADLDAHETAIRELESKLDSLRPAAPAAPVQGCSAPAVPTDLRVLNTAMEEVAKIGAAQFQIIRAAFACDLVRVVTFMWAGGAADNAFAGLGSGNHHTTSHGNKRPVLSAIDRWYSQQTEPLIRALAAASDPAGGGNLIDNTLVWYISEVAEGWNHRLTDMPFVLFGGRNTGLRGRGGVVSAGGRSALDVWLSLAPSFGVALSGLEEPHTGPIAGLFA